MDPANKSTRAATIVAPGQGRVYPMGKMRAVFKADLGETDTQYSISSGGSNRTQRVRARIRIPRITSTM